MVHPSPHLFCLMWRKGSGGRLRELQDSLFAKDPRSLRRLVPALGDVRVRGVHARGVGNSSQSVGTQKLGDLRRVSRSLLPVTLSIGYVAKPRNISAATRSFNLPALIPQTTLLEPTSADREYPLEIFHRLSHTRMRAQMVARDGRVRMYCNQGDK